MSYNLLLSPEEAPATGLLAHHRRSRPPRDVYVYVYVHVYVHTRTREV